MSVLPKRARIPYGPGAAKNPPAFPPLPEVPDEPTVEQQKCTCAGRPWNPLRPFAHRYDCPLHKPSSEPLDGVPEARPLTPGEAGAIEDFERERAAQLVGGKHEFVGGHCAHCGTKTGKLGPCPGRPVVPREAKPQRGDRSNYLPAPHFFLLNQACAALNDAFGGVHCYLVGSSLYKREYRDVDVRCILDDEHFDRLFPGAGSAPQRHALWSVMCSSIALMLRQQTDLPIDFQIQRCTQANERFQGHRDALGIFLGYPGGG